MALQVEVEQHQIGLDKPGRLNGLGSVSRLHNLMIQRQDSCQELPDGLLIFDD
jgi:hypothetical protein